MKVEIHREGRSTIKVEEVTCRKASPDFWVVDISLDRKWPRFSWVWGFDSSFGIGFFEDEDGSCLDSTDVKLIPETEEEAAMLADEAVSLFDVIT